MVVVVVVVVVVEVAVLLVIVVVVIVVVVALVVVVTFEIHPHGQEDPPSSRMSGVLSGRHSVNIYNRDINIIRNVYVCMYVCMCIRSAIPRCGMHNSLRLSSGP